jgi:cytochrome c peroxidase
MGFPFSLNLFPIPNRLKSIQKSKGFIHAPNKSTFLLVRQPHSTVASGGTISDSLSCQRPCCSASRRMNLKVFRKLFSFFPVVVAAIVFATALYSPTINALPGPDDHTSRAGLMPIGKPVKIKAPLGLPPLPIPPDNPPTEETIALGRRLYYDPGLSADGTVSCATCHAPNLGFRDGKARSNGVGGQLGARKAPTVINAAYNSLQFWDGRSPSLEKQVEGPMTNPVEMGNTLEGVVKYLQSDPAYRKLFAKTWGTEHITIDLVTKSIASFERTVVTGNSPFDRFYYGGDKKAISPVAQRGLKLFLSRKKGNCSTCHVIGKKYALFTDGKFHNIGVGADTWGDFADAGRYGQTKNTADLGAFKTPTLRNIAETSPYMHDGSLATLKDVVDHYVGGGTSNPHLDKEIHALDFLTLDERADLKAFLESLTGTSPPNVGPPADLPSVKMQTAQKQ